MADNSIPADNIYSPYLTGVERSGYATLMNNFMALCDAHNGSEQADDACVDALILAESFMKSVLQGHPDNIYGRDENEQLFYRQLFAQNLRADETPPDYNQLLGRVAAKFNARVLGLGQKQDLEELFTILEQGGAVIVRNQDSVFVKTDPSRAAIVDNDRGGEVDINKPAPKFSEVITALQSIGIFANQMIIHPGTVSQNMVRNAPYHVIQIPELNCEIAVCDRIGEAMFVNNPLVGPHVFEMYDKAALVGVMGMKRVTYRGDWQTEFLGHVLGNAPADKSQRARVDTQKFAKLQTNKPTRLTPEILLVAMLDYAYEKYKVTSQRIIPTQVTPDHVPGIDVSNWSALDANGTKGTRGLEKGMTLAFIQQIYGLKAGRKMIPEAIEKAVLNWKEHGILPQKIEIKPLTVERILVAMLDYADEQFQETGQWLLPHEDTTDPVPGMDGENWKALNASGLKGYRGLEQDMTLAFIQQVYGLKSGRKMIPEAIEKAVLNWKEHGILPQKREVKPLTVGRILAAMLDYADEQFQETGQWLLPHENITAPVPGMDGESWAGFNANAQYGSRGLEKGMTLPVIQRVYGLKTVRTTNTAALQKAVYDWKEYGRLPERVGGVEDKNALQPAIVPPAP